MTWHQLCRLIEPHYPMGDRGRPPIGVERMLRIDFLQVWFNLYDPTVENALYDSATMRSFVDIDLGREPAPAETAICKFPHLIEAYDLGEGLFATVNKHLSASGIKVGTDTIMDATIIAAPPSTKNEDGKCNPEMHQTKTGNHWFRGLKAHISLNSKAKIIYSVTTTLANAHDSRMIDDGLHGDETRAWGDSASHGHARRSSKLPARAGFPPSSRQPCLSAQQSGGVKEPHQMDQLSKALDATPIDQTQATALLRHVFGGVVVNHRTGTLGFPWKHGGKTSIQYAWPA